MMNLSDGLQHPSKSIKQITRPPVFLFASPVILGLARVYCICYSAVKPIKTIGTAKINIHTSIFNISFRGLLARMNESMAYGFQPVFKRALSCRHRRIMMMISNLYKTRSSWGSTHHRHLLYIQCRKYANTTAIFDKVWFSICIVSNRVHFKRPGGPRGNESN